VATQLSAKLFFFRELINDSTVGIIGALD
jgi:hypothetical protein